MDEKIEAVINHNRSLQCNARELNIRAGEIVFPVMNQAEWKSWLAVRLNGARRAGEIVNFEALRLPELDQKIVNTISTDNPDIIEVLGLQFSVAYRSGCAPQITLKGELVEKNHWNDLPETGIKLPGGRLVEVKIVTATDWYGSSYSDTNIPALKEKVRNHFNQKVWEGWLKPEITIPDLVTEGATIPEIETREYGRCVVTAVPLIAYGTLIAYKHWSNNPVAWKYEWYRERKIAEENREKAVAALAQFQSEERKKRALATIVIPDPSQEGGVIPEIAKIEGGYGVVIVNSSRHYGSDPWFKIYWTQSRDEAERYHENAVKKLEEIKAEEIKKRKLQDAKSEAETVKSKASELYYNSDNSRLEQTLKEKLYSINRNYLPSELEELRNWTAEARTICTQVEVAYAEIQRKKENRSKDMQIPQGLLAKKAFNGDEDKAYDFMQKVVALPTSRLDSHIVQNCGRARVQSHLVEVSGDPEFFMGADPNTVAFYIAEVHFCSKPHQNNFSGDMVSSSSISSGGSMGSFGEALLRARVGRK